MLSVNYEKNKCLILRYELPSFYSPCLGWLWEIIPTSYPHYTLNLDLTASMPWLVWISVQHVSRQVLLAPYKKWILEKKITSNTKYTKFKHVYLTLKASITNSADNILIFFFFFFFFQKKKKKKKKDISCESSAWQRIHMKCQDLFRLKIF